MKTSILLSLLTATSLVAALPVDSEAANGLFKDLDSLKGLGETPKRDGNELLSGDVRGPDVPVKRQNLPGHSITTKKLADTLLKKLPLPLLSKKGLPTDALTEALPVTGGLTDSLPLVKRGGGLTSALPTDELTGAVSGLVPHKERGLPTDSLTDGLPTAKLTDGLLKKLPLPLGKVKKSLLPTDSLGGDLPTDSLTQGLPLAKKSLLPTDILGGNLPTEGLTQGLPLAKKDSLPLNSLAKHLELESTLKKLPLPLHKKEVDTDDIPVVLDVPTA